MRAQILMRLAPFHFQKQPPHGMPDRSLQIHMITRGSNPHQPLTSVADVLRASKRPKNVIQIVRDVDDEKAPPPLWLASTIGNGDGAYFAERTRSRSSLCPF
jgi:hypothetical protein